MSALLRLLPFLTVLVLAADPVSGQPPEARTPTADPLQALAWLAGHWVGEGLGGWNETLWSAPRGGSMMGMFRHMREGEVVFYEFLTLRMRGDTLVKALKHFHPDRIGWEERTRSVEFPLLRVEGDTIVFDHMTYRRDGPDRMEITVMLADPERLEAETFVYRRVRH